MTDNTELSKYLTDKITIPEYDNFLDFLKNIISKDLPDPVLTCNLEIDALPIDDDDNISIDSTKCIGCLGCILAVPVLPPLDNQTKEKLTSVLFEKPQELDKIADTNNIFSGEHISLPDYDPLTRQSPSRSFERFTDHKETKNIALWLTTSSKFLSSKGCRFGKEINLPIPENPRDARLDVCAKSNSNVLVLEAKVSLSDMMEDPRYAEQMPNYMAECKNTVEKYDAECNTNTELSVLLAIGGQETDLYPPEDERNTAYSEYSKKFYNDLLKHKIQFISANAFWVMALHSILTNKIICWDKLFPKIFSRDGALGLLTSGLVVHKDSKYSVESISELIASSYR